MGVRRLWLLLFVLLIPAGAATAGDHKADVYVAGSYLRAKGSTIKIKGWHVSGAMSVENHRWLSFIGDLSVHFWGTDDAGNDVTQITFMVGPRFAPFGNRHYRHKPFAHVMFLGATHRTGEGPIGSTSAGAVAGGVGYDFTPGDETWGGRFQADYIWPVSSSQGHGWRFSAGAIYRFKF